MNKMHFSLVVATINRYKELEKLLDSLVNQTYQDFEVIVVDQNNDDRLSGLINRFALQLHITHIVTKIKGASHARNIGTERSKGDIISYPDDDCEYPETLLQDIAALFAKNADIDVISVSSKDKHGEGKIARLGNTRRKVTKYNVLWSCIEFGIFAKSECFREVKFDEDMGVGAYSPWWSDEGADLVMQMLDRHKVVCYFPDVFIYHPDPVKNYDRKAIVRSFRYGCGRGYFLQKHNYNFAFVLYVWGLYVVGILLSVFKLNTAKASYYFYGLKGRVLGYFQLKEAIKRTLDCL